MSNDRNKTEAIYGRYGWLIGPSDLVEWMEANALRKMNQDTRHVTLLFKRDALVYDISNVAYVEGDVMNPSEKRGMGEHAGHQTQDIAEDGNIDRVTRMLDLAHALCVEMLYPYTQSQCNDGMELTDDFSETACYRIEMDVPSKFSHTTAILIEKLIHEFMVARVLSDWLMITKPDAAQLWAARASEVLDKAKSVMRARSGILTRPLRPF